LHTEHLGFLALSKGLINQFASQTDATAAIGEPEQAHKAHNMAASNKLLFSFFSSRTPQESSQNCSQAH